LELLGEITRPAIRDLKVEFKGLRPARVYPEELPNLAPGTQQILLGRYLPEGKDQTGQVIVTGTLNDKLVKFTADVSLKEAEDGNSFIPRLWARMHLDVLLEQGTSQSILDEIIGLSEEYHIMTPYTSLLVLETDADRERFKVKRRFEMSDGQRFFAEGHDNANYELVQQQMRRAGDWRVGLGRQVLSQLIDLGRDANVFAQPWSDGITLREKFAISDDSAPVDSVWGGGFGSYKYDLGGLGYDGRMAGMGGRGDMLFTNGSMPGGISRGGTISVNGKWNRDFDGNGPLSLDFADGESLIAGAGSDVWFEQGAMENKLADLESNEYFGLQAIVDGKDLSKEVFDFDGDFIMGDKMSELGSFRAPRSSSSPARPSSKPAWGLGLSVAKSRERYLGEDLYSAGRRYQSQSTSHWIDGLFPGLPGVLAQYKAPKDFKPWPVEARRLAESLLRTKQMASLKGGLIVEQNAEHFDTRWGNLTSRSEMLELVSPKAWLTRTGSAGSQTTIQWRDAKSRNILSDGFQLAWIRKSEPRDLSQPPLSLIGKVVTSLERTYWSYDVSIEKTMAGRSTGENQSISILTLKHPTNKDYELRYYIDTKRNVLVRSETRQKGKVTSSAVFSDFVEVAGAWWATRADHFDKDENRTSFVAQKIRQVDVEEFGRRIDRQLAGLNKVQFLSMPLPKLGDAKKARDEGKATFEDQVVLMLHFAASQQWDRVVEHFEAAEKLAADKPGMFWVRNAVLNVSRRREELRQRILTRAEALAGPRIAGQLVAAEHVYKHAPLARRLPGAGRLLGRLDREKSLKRIGLSAVPLGLGSRRSRGRGQRADREMARRWLHDRRTLIGGRPTPLRGVASGHGPRLQPAYQPPRRAMDRAAGRNRAVRRPTRRNAPVDARDGD